MRRRAVTWALWAMLGLSACAMVRADQRPPSSTPTPPVTSDAARAATNLSAVSSCSETELRKPIAQLRWTAATPHGTEQYIDVTTRTDGFSVGGYKSSAALGADVTSLVWDAVETGINHYWRVVTVYPGVAVASEVATFKGAVCVADFQPSQSPAIAPPSAGPTVAVTTLTPGPLVTPTAATSATTSAPTQTIVAAAPSAAPRDESTPPSGTPGVLVGALIAATLIGTFLWWSRRGPA